MAAIVRSELYDCLVRKIGYSVGLEKFRERAGELAVVYANKGSFTAGDWRDLVRKWKRPKAEQHIADFYSQLDLLRRDRNTIQVLPALDVLSILINWIRIDEEGRAVDEAIDAALTFILLVKVVEADGDVFLNCLASEFQSGASRDKLVKLIRHKRGAVSAIFKRGGIIERIADAISIRNFTEDGGTQGRAKLSYAERSRLLHTGGVGGRSRSISDWLAEDISISEDYLEKVSVTRRGWAEDLGVFDRTHQGNITEAGRSLLCRLATIGLAVNGQTTQGAEVTFAFWPYGYQLRRMHIQPAQIGAPDLTAWDVLSVVAETVIPRDSAPARDATNVSREEILELLRRTLLLYRRASPRGLIRHDLPLFVAEPVLAFWFAKRGRRMPALRQFLREETKREDRGVDMVMIHGTEGGLRVL